MSGLVGALVEGWEDGWAGCGWTDLDGWVDWADWADWAGKKDAGPGRKCNPSTYA